jgi:hypothetical protein
MTFTDDERKKIAELKGLLGSAFVWSDSKQGQHYWNTVYENLSSMVAQDKKKKTPRKPKAKLVQRPTKEGEYTIGRTYLDESDVLGSISIIDHNGERVRCGNLFHVTAKGIKLARGVTSLAEELGIKLDKENDDRIKLVED